MERSPLLLSMTLNSYEQAFGRMIATHRRYADRFGYDYAIPGMGHMSDLGRESVWLKIIMLIAALDQGRPWVMFVDNDTVIRPWTPDFRTVSQPEKSIYAAQGRTGRVNSGVIIVKNDIAAREFLVKVLSFLGRPIPAKDDVGWGENGAVIHVGRTTPALEVISPRWNNNRSRWMLDYVRHYCSGPMRTRYRFTSVEKLALETILKDVRVPLPAETDETIERLDRLFRQITEDNPHLVYQPVNAMLGAPFQEITATAPR